MTILLVLSILFAVLNWIAVAKESRRAIYITKSSMMVFLIAWVILRGNIFVTLNTPDSFPLLWFILGFCLSLLGDIFLMLPPAYFLPGLIAFLAAHIFYILGFQQITPTAAFKLPQMVIAGILLTAAAAGNYKLIQGLRAKHQKKYIVPILVYTTAISLMLYSALNTWFDYHWEATASLLAVAGALNFYASDFMNAWRRFVGPIPNVKVKIMVTYHIGQVLLALAAILRYVI